MTKVLIIGGSGYLGYTIFKELNPFYDVYGTYNKNIDFKKNKRFYNFNLKNNFNQILKEVNPNLIISSLKGDFNDQIFFHEKLIMYCDKKNIKLLFISSSNVFDSFTNFPSYENDKTFSESIFGRFKINIENISIIGDININANKENNLSNIVFIKKLVPKNGENETL